MMKKIPVILFLVLLSSTVTAQKTYVTSMIFTFIGGSEFGAPIGNDCGTNDIVKTVDATEGIMKVEVNKLCHTWSFLQHWMGGAYAQALVYKHRYIEMRIRSTAPHDSGLSIRFQVTGGLPDGSVGKLIPDVFYKINKADTWEIKVLTLEGTADTVYKEIDYNFPNGTYEFDYVYHGDAAVPPIPVVDDVKEKMTCGDGKIHFAKLSGIQIPGRLPEGLTVSATAKSADMIKDVSITNLNGSFLVNSPWSCDLLFSPQEGFTGLGDSVFVTVSDTIRKTSSIMGFKVNFISTCPGNDYWSLTDYSDDIKIYPVPAADAVTVELPEPVNGNLSIVNTLGTCVYSEKINSARLQVNIAGLPAGIYFVNISDDSGSVTKRIVKQ